MSLSVDPRIGSELFGYRLDALLGRGGMGVVYKAYDQRLKRYVALKLIAPELSEDERFRERFLAESELAASLEHPNVVPIHEAFDVEGRLAIAMRYVEGTDLKQLLQTERVLDPERALAISAQVAAALDAAHARGLVHRDVKPSNVLLDETEHVYLADFGLSRRLTDVGVPGEEGLSVGTPAYVSPEQIERGSVDGRADEYALGCLLYECLTGEAPFRRDSELAVLWAHVQEEPPAASAKAPDLPVGIDPVLARAMAKSPRDRYASCGDLVDAARVAFGVHPRVWMRRRRMLVLGALGAALIAAAVLAPVFLTRGTSGPSRPSSTPTLTPKVDSLQRIDPKTDQLAATIGVAHDPQAVAVGAGRVWVGSRVDQSVQRIDPKKNEVTGRVRADGPVSITAGIFAGVLVVNFDDNILTQIDPPTLHIFDHPICPGNVSVATDERHIWAVGPRGLEIVVQAGVPQSNDLPRCPKAVSPAGFALVTGGGAVWVLDDKLRSLWRVDSRTDRVVKRFRLKFDPGGVAFGRGRVWVTNNGGNAVVEIDPAADRIVRSIPVGAGPISVTVGEGSVWVANYTDDTVSRIDPRTAKVIATIPVGPNPWRIAAGEGGVWVTVHPS